MMKKRYHIELGGQLFMVDPDAEIKLENYLDALRSYYSNEEGGEEIMEDIESRIAELLHEYLNKKQSTIVHVELIETIIQIMGTPDDLFCERQEGKNAQQPTSSDLSSTPRRLYRDTEHALIGGVASGLAVYLRVDVVWIRLILIISLFFGGIMILVYLVAWVIIPPARSAKDKLNMKGAPINVSNIEKKIKEEYAKVDVKNRFSSFVIRLEEFMRELWRLMCRLLSRVINLIAAILSVLILISTLVLLSISVYLLFFAHSLPWGEGFFGLQWIIGEQNIFWNVIAFLLVTLPPFFLLSYWALKFLCGFKGKIGIPILFLLIWGIGIGMITIGGITTGLKFIEQYNERTTFTIPPTDTLILCTAHSERTTNIGNHPFNVYAVGAGKSDTLASQVELTIQYSESDVIEGRVKTFARGKHLEDAYTQVKNTQWSWNFTNDTLTLAPYSYIPNNGEWFFNQVKVDLYLPKGQFIRIENPCYINLKSYNNKYTHHFGYRDKSGLYVMKEGYLERVKE